MDILKEASYEAISIATEIELLSFQGSGPMPIYAAARIRLGSEARPLAPGAADYSLVFYIDGLEAGRAGGEKAAGSHSFIVAIPPIPVLTGEVVSVRAVGDPVDLQVDAAAWLFDATPASEAGPVGMGSVYVDEDYGGEGSLAFLDKCGVPVLNGTIQIYTAEDFAHKRTGEEYVIAKVLTDIDGGWRRAVMLDPGQYVLIYFTPLRSNRVVSETKQVTVY